MDMKRQPNRQFYGQFFNLLARLRDYSPESQRASPFLKEGQEKAYPQIHRSSCPEIQTDIHLTWSGKRPLIPDAKR